MRREWIKLMKHQIRQDLIGKDAFRGVTQSYSWLANQFGHFGLGFIPVTIVYALVFSSNISKLWIYIPAGGVWLAWFVFEVFNFRSSVLKKMGNSYFYLRKKGHFIGDTITDLGFFAFGILAALLTFFQNLVIGLMLIVVVVFLIRQSVYWYLSKIYLQRAVYPFQFRLSQWNEKLSSEHKLAIKQFMEAPYSGTHLLVFGENDNEKIHICVGIGAEISYDLKKCRYLTAMKAFECFYREEAKDSPTSHTFSWNWEEAELLIIDDINPSHADIPEVITASEFLQKIDDNKLSTRNRERLRERKVIWMMGNENEKKTEQESWKNMLLAIGVDSKNIILIDLSVNKKTNTEPPEK
jgi:hypothetical protein